ncbi:MAG: methyltransferase family protein [Kiloniellaceae bacterium]
MGGGLIAAGFALAAWAIRTFRAAGTNVETGKPATTVVEAGPYRYSRNPIYVGLSAIMVGIGVALDNVWIVGLLVPVLAIMRVGVIGREERYLEGKFGDAYRGYRARVRRWL